MKVEVAMGALDHDVTISISQPDSEPPISETATKLSKIVSLGPEGIVFNTLVSVTIPYDDTDISDEDTLQIYAHNGSSWDGVTFKSRDTEANTITALGVHFSPHAVLQLENPEAPSEFHPKLHGFRMKNFGDYGNCGGMVSYARWIFENKKCRLYCSYDDEIQKEIAEKANDKLNIDVVIHIMRHFGLPHSDKPVRDRLIKELNDLPILAIVEESVAGNYAHFVLVYDYVYDYASDEGEFYVYDPNYPGEECVIEFDASDIKDYNTHYLPGQATVYYAVWTYSIINPQHPHAMQTVFDSFPLSRLYDVTGTIIKAGNCNIGGGSEYTYDFTINVYNDWEGLSFEHGSTEIDAEYDEFGGADVIVRKQVSCEGVIENHSARTTATIDDCNITINECTVTWCEKAGCIFRESWDLTTP